MSGACETSGRRRATAAAGPRVERGRCVASRLGPVALAAALAGWAGGVGCGESGFDCAVRAVVHEREWCAPDVRTSLEGGRLFVQATAGGTQVEGTTEELRLELPLPLDPASLPLALPWSTPGVVGALDIIGNGVAHGGDDGSAPEIEVDRHEARVRDVISPGALVVTRLDGGGVAGTFSFVARGVAAIGEQIPVEAGVFSAPLPAAEGAP